MNSGYVGYSRSVRSDQAIASYEVPVSLIDKTLVNNFLSDFRDAFTNEEFDYLNKLSVEKWKFVTKEYVIASSWHHTSSRFNRTDHYDMHKVARRILDLKGDLDELYRNVKESKKTCDENVEFGVIEVQIWGGTKKRPKLEGTELVAGIIKGDWLYFKRSHYVNGSVSKYKVSANKVVELKRYESYEELVKSNKEFKNTKRVFNKLQKEM